MEQRITPAPWKALLILVPVYWFVGIFSTYASSSSDKQSAIEYSVGNTATQEVTASPFPTGTDTPTPTQIDRPVLTDTPTLTLTPTSLPSSTQISSPTQVPSQTATPTSTQTSTLAYPPFSLLEYWEMFLPFIVQFPSPAPTLTPTSTQTPTQTTEPPPKSYLFCRNYSPPLPIPDNDPNGLSSRIFIDTPGIVVEANVYVNVNHSWVGDLNASLGHASQVVDLFDRPGSPNTQLGCSYDHVQAIFSDPASQPAEDKCSPSPAAVAGMFRPLTPLIQFQGRLAAGDWTLHIIDGYQYDTGSLNKWCLQMKIGSTLPSPTPTPTPVSLPSSANVAEMVGKNQALPLDCESRAAVDWAAFFGTQIDELDFYSRLPHSDDPDDGFVGSAYGAWGQIPPDDYGVHAKPVARLLRQYGLVASAYRLLHWEDIRAEIAAGHPVVVWVTGHATTGAPLFYMADSNQHISIVAPFEHTVNIIGYTESTVTILDGAFIYNRSLNLFLDAWSALGNMAILARP